MSKKARSEAARVASLIRANKAEYYIADVELDNSPDICATVELANKTLGKLKCAFLLVSANSAVLTTAAYVPENLQDKINAKDWQDAIWKNYVNLKHIGYNSDTESIREFPSDDAFKLKDIVRADGFKYLSDHGCLGDADSSDEYNLDDL